VQKMHNRNNHLLVSQSDLGRDASCVYVIIDTYKVLDQLARCASMRARAWVATF